MVIWLGGVVASIVHAPYPSQDFLYYKLKQINYLRSENVSQFVFKKPSFKNQSKINKWLASESFQEISLLYI